MGPRNKSMRLQVPHLMESIGQEFDLHMPVKPTSITLGLGSAMKVSYAIELFGPDMLSSCSANGASIVERIAQPDFQKMLVQHLRAAGSPRFGYDHVVVLPASWKVVQTLRYDLSWKYPGLIACRKNPGKETFPPQEENYLDAACMVFEAQALRYVVDYRGAHGVRIV